MVHQVVLPPKPVQNRRRRGVGEVAGGGAAECAAVCCCFPCVVVHIAVLAVYKVPKKLVLKAARKRRHGLLRNNKNNDGNNSSSINPLVVNKGNDIVVLHPHRASSVDLWSYGVEETRLEEFFRQLPENEMDEDEEGFEKEMWARFAGTGFWRSESQRQS